MSNKGKTGKKGKPKEFLTTGEVATELDIPDRTVRWLAKKELLPPQIRYGDEGHYRYPREAIVKHKEKMLTIRVQTSAPKQLHEQVKLQKQLGHLETIRRRIGELQTKLAFPPCAHLDVTDLSLGERHLFLYGPVRWHRAGDGYYYLRLDEFDLAIEHIGSSGQKDTLRRIKHWRYLGGQCVEKCHLLRIQVMEEARRETAMAILADTGERGLLDGFSWTIYSWALWDATKEPEYMVASEIESLCLLHELGGSNLAWVRCNEVERIKAIHQALRIKYRVLPLTKEITELKTKMDRLKEALSPKLDDFAKQEVIPGKCTACVM